MLTRARASALLFGGAALSATGLPGRAQTNATVRIAIVPIEPAAEAYYASDMGFFAEADLDVQIQPMLGSSAIVPAVASNAVDIGFSTIDTLATAHQKNVPLVVIAPASEYVSPDTRGTGAIVLPANSPIQTAKDLSGKTMATAGLNTAAETGPRVWIDKNGGDSSTVKFVEMPFSAMPAALEAGRIDAASVAEPFIGVAKKNGRVLAYFWDAVSNHFFVAAWFTTPQWAKDHPDLVKRFATVMYKTAVWANRNPTKSGEILAKYSKIDPAVIATMTRTHYGEQLTAGLMQPLIDVTAKYGKFTTFPAQELLYAPPR
jgi:NitT/TauT family transport system substrate-binding protein